MSEKRSSSRFTTRAYSLLRFAFLCIIRISGGRHACNFVHLAVPCRSKSVCRQRLTPKLTLSPDCFKTLRPSNSTFNGESGFSCGTETPVSRPNLHGTTRNWPSLPCIPCIHATADVKDEFFIFDHGSYHGSDLDDGVADENRWASYKDAYGCSWKEEDVDKKAGEFIAQFREQLELERKMSFLRFEEMLDRGTR